jgi:hypothetical protein
MALVLADRVRETTTVVGTGTATLLGAIDSYQSFAAIGNANTTYYTIVNQSANEWEVGIGTYTASGTTLSRDTVLSSSNAGSLVNFSAGTKDIWVDYAAGKAVTTDTLAYPPAIGGTTPNAATFTTLTSNGLTTLTNGSGSLIIDDGGGSIANFRLIGPTGALGRTRLYSPNQLRISTATTNSINFYTGASSTPSGDGVLQLQVSNTSSAVNYVQVTGAATGAAPVISGQGSDSSVNLGFASKGSGILRFFTGGTVEQFRLLSTASAVNYATATGAAAGSSPVFGVAGTDTNINLNLTPKGTGTVVANGSLTIPVASGNAVILPNTSITSWLYSGNSFFIGGQESAPTGLFIGSGGTKMYVNGTTGDDVNEYTLGTAWDITTATFVTVFSTAAQDTAPVDLFFKPDGLSMYVVGDTNNTVFQYTLGTAWSVATASYASKSFSVGTQETNPSGLWFKPDGTEMYVVGSATDAVYQYTLGTAWDVSTASYSGKSYSVVTQETSPQQVNLSADGTKMWVAGNIGDDIWEYDLGTAWDVSTASPVNNFYIGFQAVSPTGMFIDSSAANRVFIVDSTQDAVYQYNTATNSAEFSTDKLYTPGALSVNGNFVAGAQAFVDGSLVVQGGVSTGGTGAFNGLTSSGTTTLATATSAQTASFAAGATVSGSLKTLNIGTAGVSGSTTTINIGSAVSGSLGTTTISAPTVNIGQTATQLSVTNTASAVNYVQVTGAATGGQPTILAQGSDATVGLTLNSKGVAPTRIQANGISIARFTGVASAVNFLDLAHSVTGQGPVIFAQSISDANVPLVLRTTGTGAIDLAAGSSGVNISNGGTVTAITATVSGTLYTSIPSVAVSAPTTAGGVQATANALMFTGTATIQSGGTGYTVGNVLTIVGGTFSGQVGTYTVTGVSGGVITSISRTTGSGYSVLPSNPVSTTGGTGSGATLNLTWTVSGFTITNAGSGYVEQPTVTFSGGGGSGAAAYATVGSGTTIKSLHPDFFIAGPASSTNIFRFGSVGNAVNNLFTYNNTTGASPVLRSIGSDTNVGVDISSQGTGNIRFLTNAVNQEQLRIAHTASAVNYVQVTGAATGNPPVLSVQGSDSSIAFRVQAKGAGAVAFIGGGGGILANITGSSGTGRNYLQFESAATTVSPVLSAQGGDTNIDLALTPKGTGNVRFGTYTGTILTPTGYVEIKDAGGTIRRLLVG